MADELGNGDVLRSQILGLQAQFLERDAEYFRQLELVKRVEETAREQVETDAGPATTGSTFTLNRRRLQKWMPRINSSETCIDQIEFSIQNGFC